MRSALGAGMTFSRKIIFDTARRLGAKFDSATDVAAMDRAIDEALGILPTHEMGDVGAFFVAVRQVTGSLDQIQVDTLNRLLAGASHWSVSWLAYGLATAWHEARFKPIEEWGKGKGHPYGAPGKYGQPPYGRGLVQLTHDFNYEWADETLELGGSLLKDFARALEPDIAARVLLKGMEQGAFCPPHSLGFHLPDRLGTLSQFIGSRRIINGTDRAALIADLAVKFQDAVLIGKWA
jgi:hypothetical protein